MAEKKHILYLRIDGALAKKLDALHRTEARRDKANGRERSKADTVRVVLNAGLAALAKGGA